MAMASPDGDDTIIPYQIGRTAVRGRVVRLGPAVNDILSRHPFADAVNQLVGEAAVLVAMMGSSLKFDGRLVLHASGDGPMPMLVADYVAGGALRATASLAENAPDAGDLAAYLGKGHMAVTVDQGPDMERYQGVTPVDGATLGAAAVSYFDQSEQIPTAIKLAVGRIARPGGAQTWRAGGIIAQFVPAEGGERERGEAVLIEDDEREIWERTAAFLNTTQPDELLDPSVSAERLLYRLYHEDGVRVFDPAPVRAECGCNEGKIGAVLSRYGPEDLEDMLEDGAIRVTCEFCRTEYRFDATGAPLRN